MHSVAAASRPRLALASGRGGAAAAAAVAPPPQATLRCQPVLPAGGMQQQRQFVTSASRSRGLSQRHCLSSSSGLRPQQAAVRPQHRSSALQPCAAAAGGAAAGSGEGSGAAPSFVPMQQSKKPARPMSLPQRWRAAKFAALEAAERLSQVPAVAALLASLAALNAQLQPLRDAWALLRRKEEDLLESYNAFIAEETKRQWAWSKRYVQELAWWSRVPPFVGFFLGTLAYQAFMPVSLAATVAVPLYVSWVLFDNWWASPILLATLITAPMKWVPWADKCLVWPGLM